MAAVVARVREVPVAPTEIELEMGIKLSADAGIILASVASEANLSLKLKWDRQAAAAGG